MQLKDLIRITKEKILKIKIIKYLFALINIITISENFIFIIVVPSDGSNRVVSNGGTAKAGIPLRTLPVKINGILPYFSA